MKKLFERFVGLILSITIILLSLPSAYAANVLTQSDFVRAQGRNVIGTDGERLLIKAMALGNSVFVNPTEPNPKHHTQNTFKELSDLGFNCVRFYINYELFEDDSEPYKYKESGFEWLDKNIK